VRLCGASVFLLGCTGTISADSPSEGTPLAPGGASAAGGGAISDAPRLCGGAQLAPSPLHRLTRLEYDNTVRDLVGEDLQLGKDFAQDEYAGTFTANFFTPITEMQFAEYATAAQTVAEKAAGSMAKFVPCDPAADPTGCATRFIKQFGRRAYRRPLDDDEVARFGKLFQLGLGGADFANGVRLVVQAMLQSPKFLYLVEGPGPLTQHQLAARLSYFLWNAPPDPQLSAAADAGQLGTMAALRQQTQRLLADPRALDMITDFHVQWLGLDELPTLGRDTMLYPKFEALRPAIIEETGHFLAEVLKSDGGRIDTLMTAPFSVVNKALAGLYGASSTAADWQKTTLDPQQRAGLLTQAGFLTAHGSFDGSSPILRGLAVRERLLCAPMPVPPPSADQNFPPPAPFTTTRQRFDRHRTNPSCATCHAMMDKLGYGFESYDGIGQFRTMENGVPVDDSGELLSTDIDGPYKGAADLVHKLVGSGQFQRCVATQWFRYAFARLDGEGDKCALDALSKRVGGASMKVTDLLQGIVESDAFLTYRPVN